jgi:hypothetical protein
LVTHFVGRKTGSTCVGIYLNWENSITGSQITVEIVFWDGKVELLMTAHIYTRVRCDDVVHPIINFLFKKKTCRICRPAEFFSFPARRERERADENNGAEMLSTHPPRTHANKRETIRCIYIAGINKKKKKGLGLCLKIYCQILFFS